MLYDSGIKVDLDLSQSLNFLYSAGCRLLETINNIPYWLSSLQNKVNRVALDQLAKDSLTLAKNAVGFTLRAIFSVAMCFLNPATFLVGVGIGIFSDTMRDRVKRINKILHCYFIKGLEGPYSIRLAARIFVVALTAFGFLALTALTIPFSGIAASAYIGILMGIHLYTESSEGSPESHPPSLACSLSVLPQTSTSSTLGGLPFPPTSPLSASLPSNYLLSVGAKKPEGSSL